jgi:serine/threonine protein kinase
LTSIACACARRVKIYPLMIGWTVGSYRIVRLLGEGGMGSVYEAVNESIERRVAVKLLHSAYARQPEIVARFFNEARAVNRIAHPSIVQIHEHGRLPNGTAFIVMEYLEGQTLSERLRHSGGRLALRTALQVTWQIAAALAAAHAKNIVHRDLKPANLMLVSDPLGPGGERVKLLDFGIAKVWAESNQDKTASQLIMGTPSYMSPEQCRGAGAVDAKTDSYSLGVILYEMLCGRPPFVADGPGEVMAMHMFQVPPSVRNWVPEIPTDIADYINLLLHKDRTVRPAMRDVFQRLSELATAYAAVTSTAAHEVTRFVFAPAAKDSSATVVGLDPSTIESRGQQKATRKKAQSLLAIGSLAVLIVAGLYLYAARSSHDGSAPAPTRSRMTWSKDEPGKGASADSLPAANAPADERSRSSKNAKALPPARTPGTGRSVIPSRPVPAAARPVLTPAAAEAKLEEAQAQYVNARYARAIELGLMATQQNPKRAWRIIGMAACNLKDMARANEAYRNLDYAGRKNLSAVCARNGVLNLGSAETSLTIVD